MINTQPTDGNIEVEQFEIPAVVDFLLHKCLYSKKSETLGSKAKFMYFKYP